MGYRELQLKLPTDFHDGHLKKEIERHIKTAEYSYQIIHQSLDARNKRRIHWLIVLGVTSPAINGSAARSRDTIRPEYKRRNKRVIVTGCGPAGFFAACLLQKSGFDTVIIERGAAVEKRAAGIAAFEKSGQFDPLGNYAFGEGGAGTFSDGKLTSRSKHISQERDFIIDNYIAAGAPEEISYLAHPHIGSDNLKQVVKNLRQAYVHCGGEILFETLLTGISVKGGCVKEAFTTNQSLPADYYIIAPGHAAYETYRMLMKQGVSFRTKNFAIGSRAEHSQELINMAQWGTAKLKGLKAAEYRLTSDGDGKHPVYTFCMCPGGIVVPATAYKHTNIVNGMSHYLRNGPFANAACVAGLHPAQLLGRECSALEALQQLEEWEHAFHDYVKGYKAPFCTIRDFIAGKEKTSRADSSYPLGITAAPLWELLPPLVVAAMRNGLASFAKKVKGYDTGILLGLESKTSSPVQVIRDKSGLCEGFQNLYLAGEGSGYAGGIISSAADGVKAAMHLINSSR